MSETSKEKIRVYIVYTPASRVVYLPGALGSYFQPIHFMSKVYFIFKLLFKPKACFLASAPPLPTATFTVGHGVVGHIHIQWPWAYGGWALAPLPPVTATFTHGEAHSSRTHSHLVGDMSVGYIHIRRCGGGLPCKCTTATTACHIHIHWGTWWWST